MSQGFVMVNSVSPLFRASGPVSMYNRGALGWELLWPGLRSPLITSCHCHGWMITTWWAMALSYSLAKSPHQLLSSGGGYIAIGTKKNPWRAVMELRGSRSSDGAPERKSRKARLCPTVDVGNSTGVFRVDHFQGNQIFSVVSKR